MSQLRSEFQEEQQMVDPSMIFFGMKTPFDVWWSQGFWNQQKWNSGMPENTQSDFGASYIPTFERNINLVNLGNKSNSLQL